MAVKQKTENMFVELSFIGNIDHGEPPVIFDERRKEVKSFKHASKVVLSYIKMHNLGGGWCGGNIYENGKIIAHVSYNGRVWEGKKEYSVELSNKCKEISI